MQAWPPLQPLVLLLVANGAPVVAKKVLKSRLATAMDAGCVFFDGERLLGKSKTIRGVAVSLLSTAIMAPLLDVTIATGAWFAFWAMVGDLVSSFIKRRLKLPPSSQAIGLDQVPESLLPLLVCQTSLGLDSGDIAVTVAAFVVGELALSYLLYRLGLRDRPY
jgi:CDP-2,3-bis-(O-geranylgeranyl)-sn-glycerol synthase